MVFFKKLLSLLLFISVSIWFAAGIFDFISLLDNVGEVSKIKVSGYMNNTSSFVLFGFFLPTIPMTIISIASGLQLPKLTFRLMIIGGITFAIIGHYFDSSLREKIINNNYIECKEKRELSLKYSSRTYALSPEICLPK
ncbi:hypothetical protein [Salinivibrio sp. SS2]|uniref:hypothetical protein n=1 Tax=Salinivibrio sp. SS2 TaxID=1892894 RepID=UPI000A049063|nr:hypothetical protein [Salinivibrio sp. DV]